VSWRRAASISSARRWYLPLRRVPATVGPFRKWAEQEVKNSKLSDSATPHGGRGFRKYKTRRRRRRKKRSD